MKSLDVNEHCKDSEVEGKYDAVREHYKDSEVASTYDAERFENFAGRWFDILEKRTITKALNYVKKRVPDAVVLDAPCGTGRITEVLLRQNFDVTGGDISPAMIDVAKKKCELITDDFKTIVLDLDNPVVPELSYDLVSCIRLFHHLESGERKSILCNIAKLSRRYVLINVSYSSPYYRFRRRLKKLLGQGISRTSSTFAEIEDETKAANLVIVKWYRVLPYVSEDMVLLLEKQVD